MLKEKKSQGLSINTIVIAAIALFVLVIVIMIFATKTGESSEQIDETINPFKGQSCGIPGTSRSCVLSATQCTDRGGFVIDPPKDGWKGGCFICCSQ